MNKEIKLLKNSLMYQMSLGSRELFHSNVWAWLMEIDNNFIKVFFDDLDITQYEVVKICREKYNRDITIWLERKNTNIDRFVYLVIENKIKINGQPCQTLVDTGAIFSTFNSICSGT